MSLTAEQLEIRKTRIGASEIGALLGVDPHKTPLDLFIERVCPTEHKEEDHQRWGLDVERPILEHWARKRGYELVKTSGRTLTADIAPHLCATPDALARIAKGAPLIVADAKNVQRFAPGRMQWGEPGTGEVPTHYAAQIVVLIGLCEMSKPGAFDSTGHLVASIEGAPPEDWPVAYDPDLFGFLHDKAAQFIRDHVLTGRPPEGWEQDRRALEYVAARYRKATQGLKPATEAAVTLAQALRTMDATVKAAEAERDAVKALLLAEVGDAEGIEGVCRWASVAEKVEQATDWEGIARELSPGRVEDLIPRHTTSRVVRKGYRRLTFTKLSKEE